MSDMIGFLSVGVVVVLPICLMFWAVQWTLGPLMDAARTAKAPSSFLLSDLAWLIMHVQLSMALAMYAFAQPIEGHVRIVGLLLWCLPAVLFWTVSLYLVSQAGIARPLRRAAVFVVLVPSMAVIVCFTPLVTIQLLQAINPMELTSLAGPSLAVIGGEFASLAAFTLALHWLSRWAIAST